MKNLLLSTSSKLAAISCLIAFTGCAEYHRSVLNHTPERCPPFNCALYKDYQALGVVEEDIMYDECSADWYFQKAICAKEGRLVIPTTIEKWDIECDKAHELQAARARLIAALNAGARELAPEYAAHAQSNFDCWVEQTSEGWQKDDIARCRAGFYTNMAEVELMLMGGVLTVAPAQIVFFDFNSSQLNPGAMAAVDSIVSMSKAAGNTRHILLVGRTDKVGDVKHNKNLSMHRALVVKKELIRHGIDPHMIAIKAAGETPGPNVDAHNRRVDVLFLEKK